MRLEREAIGVETPANQVANVVIGSGRSHTHHAACRWMEESLTKRVLHQKRDRRYAVVVMTKIGTVGRKSRGQNTREGRR